MEKMTDRELLAQAYKAMCYGADLYADRDMRRHWNPLENDGDALRLAVHFDMSVEISEHEGSTYAYAGKVPRVYAMENWGDNKSAATRRAIVRAAAQLAAS